MKYLSVVPAENWFWVYEAKNANTYAGFCAKRVVVWAMFEDGSVTGLLALPDGLHGHVMNTRLVEPPQTKGEYLHHDELISRHKDKHKII